MHNVWYGVSITHSLAEAEIDFWRYSLFPRPHPAQTFGNSFLECPYSPIAGAAPSSTQEQSM